MPENPEPLRRLPDHRPALLRGNREVLPPFRIGHEISELDRHRLAAHRPFSSLTKKMPSAERASPVTLGEFLCAALLLAGVVATMWLVARPWEEPEEPCLRGSFITE